jgi:4-hydroxybenzoate polyprenyltransferase
VDVALNGDISLKALVLGLAMASWVSGFDILYSLQDYEFDRSQGLKSIPVRFGIGNALKFSRALHLITFLSLIALYLLDNRLGVIYLLGILLLAGFLLYEHSLIKPYDLSKVNKAFFTVNGYVSILFFITVLLDYLL